MHYPFCFVLLPEANKKQTGSAEQPPKTAVSSEVTQSSAPTLQHTVSGGMFAPPSVKDSKTSSAWRIPRKRKATRNQAACLTINQAELLRISKLFQSDLPFTVRRFFLAERTLQRICEDDFLPCPVDYKRNKSAWSETEHRYAEAWYDSSPDDIHSYSSDGLCLWSSLGPRAKFQCHCHGGIVYSLICALLYPDSLDGCVVRVIRVSDPNRFDIRGGFPSFVTHTPVTVE
ncbi:unnamed protein product [Calicophoron daubneyi]|uniref:Uncharacterized protein n=1 Tax=Calicophoron daubneyi TaxID=300641 RepID=A0AAV2TSZ3_CALDB